uniref:Venom peptide HtKTx3 n=1 Tax=Hadogenes troglodytes TaxID=1577150 RepID=A0A1B3IJ17_9SCOR|nr:venom peptide HtKTx3 [Hadogenes troglodytes]
MKMSFVIILLLFSCLIATSGVSGTSCSSFSDCANPCLSKGCKSGKCINNRCKCYFC